MESETRRFDGWSALAGYLGELHGERVTLAPDRLTITTATSPALNLRPIDVGGAGWLELTCVVGEMRSIGPRTVLTLNATLPIGALCAPDGRVLLRQQLPLAGLRVVDLDDALAAFEELGAALVVQLPTWAAAAATAAPPGSADDL